MASTHLLEFLLDQAVREVQVVLGFPWVLVFQVFLEDLADLVDPMSHTRHKFASKINLRSIHL